MISGIGSGSYMDTSQMVNMRGQVKHRWFQDLSRMLSGPAGFLCGRIKRAFLCGFSFARAWPPALPPEASRRLSFDRL